ncbi:MAG: hypothetical protein GY940_03365 [bacterium]|nr:hypothetical protein [bacterium]
MKKRIFWLSLIFSWTALFMFPDVVLITNPGTKISSLDKKDVKDIFTGKKTFWDGNCKITLAILEGSEVHNVFLRKFIKKTPSQYRNFWRRKVFTGEGKNPKSFKNEARLIDFVARTKGAVGYISAPTTKPVKVIEIGERKGGR